MKVLLREDVPSLGYAGEIHDVSVGYARNFLFPQQLAARATPGVLKAAEAWRVRAENRRRELRAEFEALAARIEDLNLVFVAKAGETGKLYGSVTTNDVAEKMNEELGTDIDNRKVMGEALRELGEHEVLVKLSPDVSPRVKVTILAEEKVSAEEAVDAEPVKTPYGEDAQIPTLEEEAAAEAEAEDDVAEATEAEAAAADDEDTAGAE